MRMDLIPDLPQSKDRPARVEIDGRASVVLRDVDIPWAVTFWICLKFAICAVPALWLTMLAYRLPGWFLETFVYVAAQSR